MKKGLLVGLVFSMILFAGNAMAAVPELTISDVYSHWDDAGTPNDQSDDLVTVQFDAVPVGTWTLYDATVFVFRPHATPSTPFPTDPILQSDSWDYLGSWEPLHDSVRGTAIVENIGADRYQMVADAVGFGDAWWPAEYLGDVYIHEPQGFFISYWDGNYNVPTEEYDEWGNPTGNIVYQPEYYRVMADGDDIVHGGTWGPPDWENANLYPGATAANSDTWEFNAAPVPEPMSLLLLGSGLVGLGFVKKKEN